MRTRDTRAVPDTASAVLSGLPFTLSVIRDGRNRFVQIGGELDIATRNAVRRACESARRKTVVVVDMADTTFMDCSGYGGLLAARRTLQVHGGSLTLHNQAGQPAELLLMITLLEESS